MTILQREVFDGLEEDFLFKYIALSEKFVCHFSVALVSVGKLDGVDWAFNIVVTCSMVADESVCRNVLVHLSQLQLQRVE
jgi:hypothetical protein